MSEPVNMEFLGLAQKVGPRVVLEPEVGCCLEEIKKIVHGPIVSRRRTVPLRRCSFIGP